jgi:hypothetical protein
MPSFSPDASTVSMCGSPKPAMYAPFVRHHRRL